MIFPVFLPLREEGGKPGIASQVTKILVVLKHRIAWEPRLCGLLKKVEGLTRFVHK